MKNARFIFYVLAALATLALFLFAPAALTAGTYIAVVEIYHTLKWIP